MVCLTNPDHATSLEVRKVYAALPDRTARKFGLLRVVDESGEDYLYPLGQFGSIRLTREIKKALASTLPGRKRVAG